MLQPMEPPGQGYFLTFLFRHFFQDLVKEIASERLDPVIPGSQT